MLNRIIRYYHYMSTGFSTYISRPLALINFVLIARLYMSDYMPWLVDIFPRLTHFIIFSAAVVGFSSLISGWIHYKRRPFKLITTLTITQNPIIVRNTALSLGAWIKMLEAHQIDVPPDLIKQYEFFKELDKKLRWSPPDSRSQDKREILKRLRRLGYL